MALVWRRSSAFGTPCAATRQWDAPEEGLDTSLALPGDAPAALERRGAIASVRATVEAFDEHDECSRAERASASIH